MKYLYVIDDDDDICQFVRIVAEDFGYRVDTSTRVSDFRTAFEREVPDVVVSDIVMPAEDGIELLEFLRSRDYRNTVVLISRFEGYLKSAAIFARTVGMRSVHEIPKPLTAEKVAAVLSLLAEG